MKKYNLSNIMKRAWEMVKKAGFGISEALKKSWKEAKNIGRIVKMNVVGNEYFTINTVTGKIFGKTYNAKDWIKRNFSAKWNKEEKCWIAEPAIIEEELKNERYYKTYIVEEQKTSVNTSDEMDEILRSELVNRNDGFYARNYHKSGKISYSFIG